MTFLQKLWKEIVLHVEELALDSVQIPALLELVDQWVAQIVLVDVMVLVVLDVGILVLDAQKLVI